MLIIMTHKKSKPQAYDLYKLQLINLDTIYKCLECFKDTECFQKKKNSNNIKKIKYYNCDIKEYYT